MNVVGESVVNLPENVGWSVIAALVIVFAIVVASRYVARELRTNTSELRTNGGSSVADRVANCEQILRERSASIDSLVTGQRMLAEQQVYVSTQLGQITARLDRVDGHLATVFGTEPPDA